jgi:hypothetical protein
MKTMLMTVLGLAAAAAFAQEATPDTWMTETPSVLSRAEVRAEAARYRVIGEKAAMEDPGYLPTVASSRLRAEVIAELQRARESGEWAALSAEAHDFGALLPRSSTYATRAQPPKQR